MKLLTPADYTQMPWKNGKGITHEIAAQRDGDDFLWRLSLAEVTEDGPFSRFPGKDRVLTVIEGEGLELEMESGVLTATLGDPVVFSGEVDLFSRCIDGPVRDFNVIFAPDQIAARVERLGADFPQGADLVAVFCIAGQMTWPGGLTQQAGDTALLVTGPPDAVSDGAVAVVVALNVL